MIPIGSKLPTFIHITIFELISKECAALSLDCKGKGCKEEEGEGLKEEVGRPRIGGRHDWRPSLTHWCQEAAHQKIKISGSIRR